MRNTMLAFLVIYLLTSAKPAFAAEALFSIPAPGTKTEEGDRSPAAAKNAAPRGKTQTAPPAAKTVQKRPVAAPRTAAAPKNNVNRFERMFNDAKNLIKANKFAEAASKLHALSKRSEMMEQRQEIKYLLGYCLMELNLNQISAFQFVDVIKNGTSRYVKASIEKLSIVADRLGDDSLLNYAVSKVVLEDFPDSKKDIIYYRLGEIKLKNGQYKEAAENFARVPQGSRYYFQAKFNRGLAYLSNNEPQNAIAIYQSLVDGRANVRVTDLGRVSSLMGLARAQYQAQLWDDAIATYRMVPRDHEIWHDSLFESSWAMLRAARFRSALSNFQSLHSSFYEDFYIPESLLLRSIVYLYICKYDEMEKVLGLYEKIYGPVRTKLGQFVQANNDPIEYYLEMEKALQIRKDKKPIGGLKIPYNAARYIMDDGEVKRSLTYLKILGEERAKLDANPYIKSSALYGLSAKILANRSRNTKTNIGNMVREKIGEMRNQLRDLYEQAGFIRYEMINGQKEQLKKKIAGKGFEQIDDEIDREFYVKNGYEYWPFDGEYWLDEIGNYHYLGKQSCE